MGKNDKTKIVIKLAIIGAGKKAQTILCTKMLPKCYPRTTSEGAWHEWGGEEALDAYGAQEERRDQETPAGWGWQLPKPGELHEQMSKMN